MIALLLIIYIIIAGLQIPPLIKKKYWRELIVFSVFFVFAFILNLLQVLDVKIPSPMKAVKYVVEDVLHLKY